MADNGYVRLHRKIRKNPVWTQLSPAVLKVHLYVMMSANWKPEIWYDGVQEVTVPIGSFVTSYKEICDDCGLTMRQVRDALADLSRLKVTRIDKIRAPGRAHERSLVCVLNYRRYQTEEDVQRQAKGQANDTPSDKRTTRERHANGLSKPENDSNSFEFIEPEILIERPLKEEEVKKERNKTAVGRFPEFWKRYPAHRPGDELPAAHEWVSFDCDSRATEGILLP